MKFSSLLAVASALMAGANAQNCDYIGGNYYCNEVSKIVYENVGFSGSYNRVTSMDESTGKCSSESQSFSGPLSPLDEELSLHFRGPLKLLQFGVYYPSSGNAKRDDTEECTTTQHVHHKHVKRATAMVTQTVYINQNGETVTTTAAVAASSAPAVVPEYGSGSVAAPGSGSGSSPNVANSPASSAAAASSGAPASAAASSGAASSGSPASSAASAAASSGSNSGSASPGDWTRVSYYTPGSADNCTFLNYYGGSGSGVWSSAFGNSLSYANSDNSGASSSPVALSEVTIDSNTEFVVMSGLKCGDSSEQADCGFYREGIPAYHGWNGQEKLFVFEFEMPSSSATGFNGDMPAVWMLNAQIPRTLQYGDASCSCWDTGCGEFDLFEILSTGSDKCISHLHDKQGAVNGYGGGGSSDYFSRPTSGSLKAAVIFTELAIHIQTVDEDFGSVLSSDTVQNWLDQTGSVVTLSSWA